MVNLCPKNPSSPFDQVQFLHRVRGVIATRRSQFCDTDGRMVAPDGDGFGPTGAWLGGNHVCPRSPGGEQLNRMIRHQFGHTADSISCTNFTERLIVVAFVITRMNRQDDPALVPA